tara:strand:+ start:1873 stop:2409 length:537 start_codon:yes stop_codon:yes gene_type:complete
MPSTTIVWSGENQIEMSDFIGHEDFWHKNGELLIKQDDTEITLKKGDTLVKENGKVYLPLSKTFHKGEACSYEDELTKALEVIKRRINERLYFPSGDKTESLNAISYLEFWTTPLQNSAEALGFDDYLGAFIRTSFDTEQCEKSWKIGFLKAHKVDSDRHEISIKHAEKLLAESSKGT